MSIFIWRLLSNRVPVDAKLQWMKIALASKCLCCPMSPNIETLSHLFIQGNGAREVWSYFDIWFEGHGHPHRQADSIPTRTELWAKRMKKKAKMHISRILPCLIYWFLWSERNNCRHNESKFQARHVIWQVQMHIQNLTSRNLLGDKHWTGCCTNALRRAHVEDRRTPTRPRIIKWNPLEPPWIKLNTKGIVNLETSQAAGGGVLRDVEGRLIKAFTLPLQARTHLEADMKVAAHGISVAQQHGAAIWIEMDSAQLVALLQGGEPGPASTRHTVARIRSLARELNLRFSFIHREGNKPAGELAKRAFSSPNEETMDEASCPSLIRALIRMERLGVPNLRGVQGDPD